MGPFFGQASKKKDSHATDSRQETSCTVHGGEEIKVAERRVRSVLQQKSDAAAMFCGHSMVEGCLPKEILKDKN